VQDYILLRGQLVTRLPDFRLEAYLSRWEFTARYHLTASDMQTMSVSELLTLADDHDRRVWDGLSLGYTETFGDPDLRRAISQMYSSVDEDDVLCFAGAQEGI
jgi:aspartate/methionine/tyrosine aminotransferase